MVVTPSLASLETTLAAWFDSVDRLSWYWMSSVMWTPCASDTCAAALAQSWYQGLSGAMMAYLRGLPCRSPPAKAAVVPAPSSFQPISAAVEATSLHSVAIDHS